MTNSLTKSVQIASEPWRISRYYEDAEQWTWLFWDESYPFRRLFDRLVLDSVLELACGHGTHAERSVQLARQFTVVDVISANVEICKRRLARFATVDYVVNNGYDFQPVADAACSAIFCYDAMVHFSPDIVTAYLRDTVRILRPGGQALYHHSNYPSPLDRHYGQNPHARNHMTKELFASLAQQCGLAIREQIVMDWGGTPDLDCLTLVERVA